MPYNSQNSQGLNKSEFEARALGLFVSEPEIEPPNKKAERVIRSARK